MFRDDVSFGYCRKLARWSASAASVASVAVFVRKIVQKYWRRPLLAWFCMKNRTKESTFAAMGAILYEKSYKNHGVDRFWRGFV
jgi:hypothetical protein